MPEYKLPNLEEVAQAEATAEEEPPEQEEEENEVPHTVCDRCEDLVPTDNIYTVYDGRERPWCEACMEDHTFECERCHVVATNSYYGAEGLCDTCCQERSGEDSDDIEEEYEGGVLGHGADAIGIFGITVPHGALLLGAEVETRHRSYEQYMAGAAAKALVMSSNKPRVIAKYDGSLCSGGVEFVSVPGTLEEVKEEFRKLRLYEDGSWSPCSSGCCGMHVHLSRAGFKDTETLYRLWYVVNGLPPTFFTELVGRSPNTYCAREWVPRKYEEVKDYEKQRVLYGSPGKYCALNTRKSETVEIRSFGSPYSLEELFKKLEVAYSLAMFAHSDTASADLLVPETYRQFIAANAETYPALHKAMPDVLARYQGDEPFMLAERKVVSPADLTEEQRREMERFREYIAVAPTAVHYDAQAGPGNSRYVARPEAVTCPACVESLREQGLLPEPMPLNENSYPPLFADITQTPYQEVPF